MKHILAKAPAVAAAMFVVACAGSQKNLSGPQQAALQAEEQSQKAQDQAQKARQAANKSQAELNEAQASHSDAQRNEIQANARAQQASYNAGRAEANAGMVAHQNAMASQPGRGVAETQGPAPAPAPGKVVIITTTLLFPTNSSKLSDSAKPNLDEVAKALKDQPQASDVIVEGHTDSTGSAENNMKLSEERAQAVADYLSSQGVSKDRIQIKGVGSEDPASHEKTAEGRAVNRRVDIQVEAPKGAAEKQGSGQPQPKTQPQPANPPASQPGTQQQKVPYYPSP